MRLPTVIETSEGFAAEGAGPVMLEKLLERFEDLLRVHSPVQWGALRPGLPVSRIQEEFDRIGLPLPDELSVWWSWKNGFEPGVPHGLRNPQLPLELTLHLREDDYFGTEWYEWNPAWLRIAGEGTKASIAARCSRTEPLLLRHVSPEFTTTNRDDAPRQATSLCVPVTWWIEGIESGRVSYDAAARAWNRDDSNVPADVLRSGLT